MNITPIKVEAFRIDQPGRDPIDVMLWDGEPGSGEGGLTIACPYLGRAWTVGWGSLGSLTARQMVTQMYAFHLADVMSARKPGKREAAIVFPVIEAVIAACKELEEQNAAAQS